MVRRPTSFTTAKRSIPRQRRAVTATPETRTVTIENVKIGDYIDLAIDPTGPDGDPNAPDGEDDRASVDVRIFRVADLSLDIATDVRSQMIDVNATSYLRVPFQRG